MPDSADLAELPLLPRNEEGPVFAEPWQAQAFAVVVEFIESGQISQEEWAQRLSSELREAEGRGEYDTGHRYYDHWLRALERLVVEKGLTQWEDLAAERKKIDAGDHHHNT